MRRIVSLMFLAVVTSLAVGVRGDEIQLAREWPFMPLKAVDVPDVDSAPWVANAIDAFVLSKLQAKGLSPAPQASREMLIRRLYLGVMGLPPTPDEIDRFVNDDDPRAYEKLVDQLLDDPRYGERWARFWLDLARYADTAGYEGDPDLPHAWRYRDYVIDSLNRDKPYDQFIREQIAGDELENIMGAGDLPNPQAENIVALTFLRLAPFTEPRGDETRHEMLSEMTSTVGSVFLGLTLGCAKCHDHKYDQIPTEDFYRMKAFFATVQIPRPEPGDSFQIGGPLAAKFYRKGERDWAAKSREKFIKSAADAKKELGKLEKQVLQRLGSPEAGMGMQLVSSKTGNDYLFETRAVNDGQLHYSEITASNGQWRITTDGQMEAPLESLSGQNRGRWFADLAEAKHVSLGQHTKGSGQPEGNNHRGKFAEVLIYANPLTAEQRETLAAYIHDKYSSSETEESVRPNSPPQAGLQFWLDASDVDADPATPNPPANSPIEEWVDKIGKIRLTQQDVKLQPRLEKLGLAGAIEFDDDFLAGDVGTADFLKNKSGSMILVYSAVHGHEGYGFEVGGNGEFLTTVIYPNARKQKSFAEILKQNPELLTKAEQDRYEKLSSRERFVKQHLKRLEPVAMSLRHSYGPPYEPGVPTSRVMIRGEYDNPGKAVEPGFLSCITGNQEAASIRLDPFKRWPTRSRRLALANWIASAENPLTARVMVNRLWHWHFGQGIVTTPSDFGQLSGGASHPELLDWLALKFVEQKWSLKSIHRLILNSNTYRQTSLREDAESQKMDPDNRWLWRFNRRRLDAETIRDSVLFVSGRLNPEQFGLPIFPPLPGDLADRVKYTESKWDTQHGPEGRKRSIYIYQQRTLTMPLMQTFDALVCDESRPRRRSSVTPLQSLAMYNGEFVNEEASHFAARVRKAVGDQESRQLEMAFRLALGRAPTSAETTTMIKLRSAYETPEEWLIGLCRVLYNTNEFIYVD